MVYCIKTFLLDKKLSNFQGEIMCESKRYMTSRTH